MNQYPQKYSEGKLEEVVLSAFLDRLIENGREGENQETRDGPEKQLLHV